MAYVDSPVNIRALPMVFVTAPKTFGDITWPEGALLKVGSTYRLES